MLWLRSVVTTVLVKGFVFSQCTTPLYIATHKYVMLMSACLSYSFLNTLIFHLPYSWGIFLYVSRQCQLLLPSWKLSAPILVKLTTTFLTSHLYFLQTYIMAVATTKCASLLCTSHCSFQAFQEVNHLFFHTYFPI